jgi:hypothetical protein
VSFFKLLSKTFLIFTLFTAKKQSDKYLEESRKSQHKEKKAENVGGIKKTPNEHHATEVVKKLIDEWNVRMEFVEKNGAIEEPILGLHRIILNETKSRLGRIFKGEEIESLNKVIDGAVVKLWLQNTDIACKNKML